MPPLKENLMSYETKHRTRIILNLLLVLVAGLLIAMRVKPELAPFLHLPPFDWPLWIILAGVLLLAYCLFIGSAGVAILACIIAGVGCILYFQNATGNWGSWSYMWTLIPGFYGIGSILAGILGDDFEHWERRGESYILVSSILFGIFATLFRIGMGFGMYPAKVSIASFFLIGILLFVLYRFMKRK